MPYVMPSMSAAKALAATLAGTPTRVVFPLMPVAIKTPALPIVVAAPAPGAAGKWQSDEAGVWQFVGEANAP
jgi:rubredoxin-NAD+ reductase